MIGLKDGIVELEQYTQEWILLAKETMYKLKNILGNRVIDIQHVGSTSIVGIMAKPIIDIEVGVNSIKEVMSLIPILQENGFYYRPRTSNEEHILFACRDLYNEKDTHYIHVVIYGKTEWTNNLKFRDNLNENPDIRKEYENLKLKLSIEYPADRTAYTNMKSKFIKRIICN